jgi:hypothetical protein
MTERPEPATTAPGRLCRRGCLVLLACAACGGDTEERPSAGSRTTEAAARTVVPRAADDALTIVAYRSPAGFPLPFHTAVPGSFQPGADLEGDGAAVRFTWAPAGELRDSAFVYVRVMEEGTREGRAREIVRTAAERVRIPGDHTELEPRRGHAWAAVEYPIRSQGTLGEPVQGWVALGRRDGRWFYVIAHAPVDAWPRFSPRAELILSEWRWVGPDGELGRAGLASGR